ncbi:hypothetical protein FM038_011365 [Shewanella eurypsychrophilus]|uniref:Uncharacterized protein n=1 Tax=Shewanella eurypsychrophilus TaxID=2593656 RepID=A0ABX6V7L2_9GAMM|nr:MULTISPECIES: hypothetical protein [Shewanella]QFU22695.1 hypothetical protein FS418_12945 [Shewanella sp. YLB-09]QPG57984.1 hypothetical protein FM038_011365 [Shewanella eurypsychrophilus]
MTIGKKSLLTLLIIFTGLLITFVQTFAWSDAGKSKQDKAYEYDFQLNYWNEEVHKKFNNLRSSEVVNRLLSFEGKRVVDSSFFLDIHEYHFLIKELMRVLKFKSKVSINLLGDIVQLNEKGLQHVPDMSKVSSDVQEFDTLLQEFDEREKRLETFLPELVSSFKYEENMSSDKKVELTVKQMELFLELYTDEALFVTQKTDPFLFVRDLGNMSYITLGNYKKVLKGYNKQVSIEDSYKKSILILLALLSVYFSALIVLKTEDEPTRYEASVNDKTYNVSIKT